MFRNLLILFFLTISTYVRSTVIEDVQMFRWSKETGFDGRNITCFEQDNKGFLWIASAKGLTRFDGVQFIDIPINSSKQQPTIIRFFKDKNNLYALTINQEYYKIDTDILLSSKISLDRLNSSKLIECLNKLKLNTNDFYKGKISELNVLRANQIVTGLKGRLWYISNSEGVGFYDPSLKTLFSVKNIRNHPAFSEAYSIFSTLYDLRFTSIFCDNQGSIWIGTLSNGIFKIALNQKLFQFYQIDYRIHDRLAEEDISCAVPLLNGDIWIGAWGAGINILKKENLKNSKPEFEIITPEYGKQGALNNGNVFPIIEDVNEDLWIGTFDGIHVLEKKNKEANNFYFQHFNKKSKSIPSDSIMDIYEEKSDVKWIATANGLTRYLPKEKKFESDFKELFRPDFFKGMFILTTFLDSKNRLWVTTKYRGIFKWNRNTNYITNVKNHGSTSANEALKIIEGADNSLWFSGLYGLFHYNLEKGVFDFKLKNKNFTTDHIESMIIDNDGDLWLGTDDGVFIYNPRNGNVKNINLPIGIRSNRFTRGVSKDKNGYLYFGTRNGFYRFYPKTLKKEGKEYKLKFTDLKINGLSYRQNEGFLKNINSRDISIVKKIDLNYTENTFSIEYSDLKFVPNVLTNYETSISKIHEEDNWTSTFDTSKSWNNLGIGDYIFKIKRDNSSEVTKLKFSILAPWWQTYWAFSIYSILFVFAVFTFALWSSKRATLKEKKYQKEKYDKLRFRFFLNISHEIRTPLTLIKGGIERLIEGNAIDINFKNEIERVHKNSERIGRLVNEVLDLKKIERSEVNVNLRVLNLKLFLENVVDVFRFRENERKLILKLPKHPIWVHSDKELLETIAYNLLSNAIKYSDIDAVIKIKLNVTKLEKIHISIEDNGYGIKKEDQQLIFERFYQSEEHLKTGTGIGLALVKQYVDLLKGKIELQSEIGKGSKFTVSLPYNKVNNRHLIEEDVTIQEKEINKELKPTILIIDDQKDLRTFIKEIFEPEYKVYEASNGEEGLKLVKEVYPTLVISDFMMPVMNGVEFCVKMRSNISTSHIPLVLLTAKTGDAVEVEVFESGADAYVNKPFSQLVLKSRVESLIANRKKIIEKYGNSSDEKISILASNSMDKVFLEKFETLLEEKYPHTDLSIEELASDMAVSVSGFYRKIKSITGKSPVEFVRLYRLKKSALLLKTTTLSITEISEETGFGTQKYFSNCFKKHFNISPLKYRNS